MKDGFMKLEEAIELVLGAARLKAETMGHRAEESEAKKLRTAASTVEDFFVNNVFDD